MKVLVGIVLSMLLVVPIAAQEIVDVDQLMVEVISERPHDPEAFTQGLLWYDGFLYESTGLYGESSLRKVDPQTGEVLQQIDLENTYFAEGLERVDDTLIQLTWKENTAFVYDLETFEEIGTHAYDGEGWGLCSNGDYLYMSDGSSYITVREQDTFNLVFDGLVTLQGRPLQPGLLNELECVGGSIYGNLWQTDFIVEINARNGNVVSLIDASGLLPESERAEADVLNGIAYDPEADVFYITGKLWPRLFEVRFVPAGQ